jgi:hypothetical protein
MTIRIMAWRWLGIAAVVCGLGTTALRADDKESRWTSTNLPLEKLSPELRERLTKVVDHPAVYTHGPMDEIVCDAPTYFWLLDHPDRATRAWCRLGAKCVDIRDAGNDSFTCSDTNGNDVRWSTVYRSPEMRIWYAEGTIKVGALVKPVTGEAVLVVRHVEGTDAKGRTVIRQQTDMIVHADSKTATLVAKLLGATMPQLAEQYIVHQGKFFSLLATYLWAHPNKVSALLAPRSPDEESESALTFPTSPTKAKDAMKGTAPK